MNAVEEVQTLRLMVGSFEDDDSDDEGMSEWPDADSRHGQLTAACASDAIGCDTAWTFLRCCGALTFPREADWRWSDELDLARALLPPRSFGWTMECASEALAARRHGAGHEHADTLLP